jgi:hypothetical protein
MKTASGRCSNRGALEVLITAIEVQLRDDLSAVLEKLVPRIAPSFA